MSAAGIEGQGSLTRSAPALLTFPPSVSAATPQDLAGTARAQAGATSRASSPKSAAWQLRLDEAVVLAGCIPPARASRYFGVTPYLYSWRDREVRYWGSHFLSEAADEGSVTLKASGGEKG